MTEYERSIAEHNRIWNAAIEAAARIAEGEGKLFVAREIRKLKK